MRTQPSACSGHSVVFLCTATVSDCRKKASSGRRWCAWVDILTPIHPQAVLLVDRNVRMWDIWLQQVILLHVPYLTKLICVHLEQTTGLWNVIAKYSAMLVLWERRGQNMCKIRQTQPVFLQFLKQTIFSTWDSTPCWPGCQPECGQSLSLSFLPVESASQLLLLVYLFLLSPPAGCVKCYYRLLPLGFVSLTLTFTGNLGKTIGKNSSQDILGSVGLSPWCFTLGSSERKVAV